MNIYTITMWMALEDVDLDMGCLYFYPGKKEKKMKEEFSKWKQTETEKTVQNL